MNPGAVQLYADHGIDLAAEPLRNRALCFAHAVYLDAVRFAVASSVGGRGSAVPAGIHVS
ncbi:MAG: hypothetical protein NTW96_12410 [Planctomycetia bacterium]|nr:hypothetical protein [Planctomycetia bacterium]